MADDKPKDESGVEKILAQNAGAGGKRSPLYRWMWKHHDRLATEFDELGTNWRALLNGFIELGLTDRNGKNPTLRGAQETWYKVRRDVAAARARKSQTPKPAAVFTPVVRSPLPSAQPAPVPPAPAATPAKNDPAEAVPLDEAQKAMLARLQDDLKRQD